MEAGGARPLATLSRATSSGLAVVQVRCVCDGRWDALCGLRGAGLLLAGRGVCLQLGAADPCGEAWLSTLTLRILRGATQVLRSDSYRNTNAKVLVSLLCACECLANM